MNRLERMISKYPNIKFNFEYDMPTKLGGLTYGDTVYINDNKPNPIKLEYVAEEISHVKYTAGDITSYKNTNDLKQEKIARQKSYQMIVDLDSLIACFINDISTPWEIAEYLECTEKCIYKALDTYRIKNGITFDYKGYRFDLSNGFNMYKI